MTALPYSRGLDQTCHACGLIEAAGDYCTRCGAPTASDWRPGGSPAQRAQREQARAARRSTKSARNPGLPC